jgi:hypothetical protein
MATRQRPYSSTKAANEAAAKAKTPAGKKAVYKADVAARAAARAQKPTPLRERFPIPRTPTPAPIMPVSPFTVGGYGQNMLRRVRGRMYLKAYLDRMMAGRPGWNPLIPPRPTPPGGV